MSRHDVSNRTQSRTQRLTPLVIFGLVWAVIWPSLLGGILYLTSGEWNWPVAWAYLGTYAAILALGSLFAIHPEPDFQDERTRAKEGTKAWDKWLSGPLFSPLWLGLYAVAGLDRRFAWPGDISTNMQIGAVAAAGLSYTLPVWAMAANRFYSRYARIQTDRGHTVVSTGPYRHIRHPGYAGLSLFMLASALALGSLWALIPAGLIVVVLMIRTALEDKMLIEELPGYAEYTQKTRFRLIPGVW